MVQHDSTIVRNELTAQFNQNKLQTSLKQKQLSLCHNEKPQRKPKNLSPEANAQI